MDHDAPGRVPAPSIPDHELLRRIGRGSYGEVWLARNMMGAYRAVKVVYRRSFKDDRPFKRELSGIQKFEPISRSHEGFVDVLHVGINETEGYFYYVMELGDDQTSGQKIDPANYSAKTLSYEISLHGRLPATRCLELGLALSQVLIELHRNRLVHRDVKPSNIIFVNGVPKLADIGLVAEVGEQLSTVGTPGFVVLDEPGSPQADIYGLGKVLYEASTGNDRQDFPVLPSHWDAAEDQEILIELNEVILRACQHDVSRRYQNASDLQADLLLLTNGKSVKRLRILERRLANLKKAGLAAAAVLFVVGIIGYQIYREWSISQDAHQRLVGENVANGNGAMAAGDFTRALRSFTEALRLDNGNKQQQDIHRMRVGSVLAQCPKVTRMWFRGSEVDSCQFNPGGAEVLILRHDGMAEILDSKNEKAAPRVLGGGSKITAVAYSPVNHLAATCDKFARIWDASSWTEVMRFPLTNAVSSVRFSPDGNRLVTAFKNGMARVWNLKERRMEFELRHGPSMAFAAFSNHGDRIVTTGFDGVKIWDVGTHLCVTSGLPHCRRITYAAFSPDDQRLVTASDDKTARVWQVGSGNQILPDLLHEGDVWSAEFSPDGRWILTADLSGNVCLWSADKLKAAASNPILWHSTRVTQASFSSDGHQIVTACIDGTVRIWDLAGIREEPAVMPFPFSGNGGRYLVFTNRSWQTFDTLSRRALSPPVDCPEDLRECRVNINGRFVLIARNHAAASTNSSDLEIHDALTGKPLGPAIPMNTHLKQVVLADNGNRVLTFDGIKAQSWDVATGRPLGTRLHESSVKSGTFDPLGNVVATSTLNGVHLWDCSTGRELFAPLVSPVPISHVEFSPYGSRFLTCGADEDLTPCSAQVWQTATGQPVGTPLAHTDGVRYGAFSADGKRVVTAGEDNFAIVWDASSGQRLKTIKHPGTVDAATFAANDRWIITRCEDDAVRLWNAATGGPITAPVRYLEAPGLPALLPDQRTVVTLARNRQSARVWDFSEDVRNWPAKDLVRLAWLLTGGAQGVQNTSEPAALESTESMWKDLPCRHPGSFIVSTNDIAEWHRVQATESATEGNLFAQYFHLKRLQALRPDDPAMIEELKQVEARLRITDRPTTAVK